MDDDQERCPCCGSGRTVAARRSFPFDLLPAFVCTDCGAECRHEWKPHLAMAGLFGGGAVAMVAGGSSLWAFLAADPETSGGETWIEIALGAAFAVGAGYAAKRAWTFLRAGPEWVVVERMGRIVEPIPDREEVCVQVEPTKPFKPSRWDSIGSVVAVGVLALAAICGIEDPHKRSERERRERLTGANGPVVRSDPMRRSPGPSSTPATEACDADVGVSEEPFSPEVLEKLEAWKRRTPRGGSDLPYLDDVLQLPTASPLAEGDSNPATPAKATLPLARPVLLDIPPHRASGSTAPPDVTDPASVPKD